MDQLRKFSVVVADTGDFNLIEKFKPTDATTNPSLIFQVAVKPGYEHIVNDAVKAGNGNLDDTIDIIYVTLGCEILKVIPGRISTEVNPRLSFDVSGSVNKAVKLVKMYEERGISKERILIKLASTWEGIEAARILEKDHGIHCNLTLLFCLTQAVACAEAGVTLISPFVGRIFDYYKVASYEDPFQDPGVKSVTSIFNYYKKFGYKTQIMGASFRNIEQILCLAGCDLLTISPSLMDNLTSDKREVKCALNEKDAKAMNIEKIELNEPKFRFMLNQDEMAHFKLGEGIRNFVKDYESLESLTMSKIKLLKEQGSL